MISMKKSIPFTLAAIGTSLFFYACTGEKTEQRLILHFGSVARIAAAPVDDIAGLVGHDLAVRIHEALQKK